MMGIAFAEYEPSDAKGFVKTVVVANYFPCGNVEKKFTENVVEPMQTTAIDKTSKLQRKLDQYMKKKARRKVNTYSMFGVRQAARPGNLVWLALTLIAIVHYFYYMYVNN